VKNSAEVTGNFVVIGVGVTLEVRSQLSAFDQLRNGVSVTLEVMLHRACCMANLSLYAIW
jgi:hypothetical protein